MKNGNGLKRFNNRVYETSFKMEYCDMLIRHSEEGGNVVEFAAKIGVNKYTVSTWIRIYPEFRKAKEIADLKRRAYWEGLKRNDMQRRFDYRVFAFIMIGSFGYKNPRRPPKK